VRRRSAAPRPAKPTATGRVRIARRRAQTRSWDRRRLGSWGWAPSARFSRRPRGPRRPVTAAVTAAASNIPRNTRGEATATSMPAPPRQRPPLPQPRLHACRRSAPRPQLASGRGSQRVTIWRPRSTSPRCWRASAPIRVRNPRCCDQSTRRYSGALTDKRVLVAGFDARNLAALVVPEARGGEVPAYARGRPYSVGRRSAVRLGRRRLRRGLRVLYRVGLR
jgi:hypothetical protein